MMPRKEELVFLPLGGSNEIGMNVNLYHYQGKWLIIDLGAGFADDYYPGVDMLAPDLSFVYENRKDFLGIVLTHAHEDHLGSVGFLWEQLKLPIYATPFTAGVVRAKLEERGYGKAAKITEVQPGSTLEIGPFSMELVSITHSIPEMNGVMLRTEYGNIFHTGDWKLDPNPVAGVTTDFEKLKRYGDEGVLAMVCDSTNVFNDRFSGSEGDLKDSLKQLIQEAKGLVVVTTFASNVGRMETIARAAKECGRKVVLAGRSLWRIDTIGRDNGYLADIDSFLTDVEFKRYPRDELLVICTGCQGEPNAAVSKIIAGDHPFIKLTQKDTVIFSSKIIPGNEKKIFKLFNAFVRLGAEVYTEKDHFVHVSGHPSRQELKTMYELVRPHIAIPVHGEPVHLHEHSKLAKSYGVPKTVEIQNGEMVRLAPGDPKSMGFVKCGYLAVDGYQFHPGDGPVMRLRRKMQKEGMVFVSVVLNKKGHLAAAPDIMLPGVIDESMHHAFLDSLIEELADAIDYQNVASDEGTVKLVRKIVRRAIEVEIGKHPSIEVMVVRV